MSIRFVIIDGWLVFQGLAAPQAVEATESVCDIVLYVGILPHFLGKSVANISARGAKRGLDDGGDR
jgi:hypothetical protein